ncbi:MAG: MBL fold metallo-hydrolase [Pirellulales bacterium]
MCEFLLRSLPSRMTTEYGGSTTCIEIDTADETIVLDAGGGLVELGYDLMRRVKVDESKRKVHLLFSHCHIDHLFALPLIPPFYDPRFEITLSAAESVMRAIEAVMAKDSPVRGTLFPTTLDRLAGIREYRTIAAGDEFKLGGTRVSTFALNHPGGAVGYRFERGGKVVVLATDHEHLAAPDSALADFARDANLLYTDGQYSEDEYLGKVGVNGDTPLSRVTWGHSAVERVAATACAAGVKRLHIGHHDPRRSDEALYDLEVLAKASVARLAIGTHAKHPPETCLVREGMSIEI